MPGEPDSNASQAPSENQRLLGSLSIFSLLQASYEFRCVAPLWPGWQSLHSCGQQSSSSLALWVCLASLHPSILLWLPISFSVALQRCDILSHAVARKLREFVYQLYSFCWISYSWRRIWILVDLRRLCSFLCKGFRPWVTFIFFSGASLRLCHLQSWLWLFRMQVGWSCRHWSLISWTEAGFSRMRRSLMGCSLWWFFSFF